MAGRIPESFIDELMTRVDLVAVIDARVPLRKAGREFIACCPFHSEKTPSFTVSPEKQFYHCFGCGAHGTAVGFLMEYEHLEFMEALEDLAAQVGLTVPKEVGRAQPDSAAPLYAMLDQASRFFRRQLRAHRDAGRAVQYLKARGLSGAIAAEYGLGFAPPGWDSLRQALGNDEHGRKALIDAGLLIDKGDGQGYDRFRDRIMFPIRDRRGRVIGFGGRVLGEGEPKYLNSPETPVFHKGRELFGLYEARQALRRIERLLVVEGYMDVVALAQFGIRDAVATLGTATTPEHLEAIFRTTSEAVFCFDGDRAGRDAAWKALETVLPLLREGRRVRFLVLPQGEDPDSQVRSEGPERFQGRIAKATPLSEFFYERLTAGADLSSMDGRARLVDEARALLDKLPAGIFQHLMIRRLAELVRMQPERLEQELGRARKPRPRQALAAASGANQPSAVRKAVAMLIQHPSLASLGVSLVEQADPEISGVPLLVDLLELLQARPTLSTGALLERWRGSEEGRHLEKLALWPLYIPDEGLDAEFSDLIYLLEKKFKERRIERLLAKARAQGLSPEEKSQLNQLLSRGKAGSSS